MSDYLFDDNHLFEPVKEELSDGTVKALKSKGYIWDPHESWWVRVWKTVLAIEVSIRVWILGLLRNPASAFLPETNS